MRVYRRRSETMSNDKEREERIREEAFMLWNADGRPEVKADEYWSRAEKVIAHQDRLAEENDRSGNL
jgi:hypothetical protein